MTWLSPTPSALSNPRRRPTAHLLRGALGRGLASLGLASLGLWAHGPWGEVRAQSKPVPPRLSFVSERDGQRDVYLIGGDGRGETRLTFSPEDESNGPSAPDGTRLLVTIGSAEERRATHGFRFALLPLVRSATTSPLSPLRDRGLDLLSGSRAWLREPSFLPDGKRLVFESEPDTSQSGLREIFLVQWDAGPGRRPTLRQLTQNREGNFEPTVCGKTDYIAFTSSRDQKSELYRMRTDGSDLRRLTYAAGSKWQPRCSPDGVRIFFVSDRDGADRIYSVHKNGSEPKRLTRAGLDPTLSEDSPALSPDGRKVAYVRRGATLGARLHVLDQATERDCEVPTPPGSRASDPDWSPRAGDGTSRLAFSLQPAAHTDAGAAAPASPKRQIFVSDDRCARITPLTTARGPNWHPLWIR